MDSERSLFLLELFEGKLSLHEIENMDLYKLLQLEEAKEKQINKKIRAMKGNNRNQGIDSATGVIINKAKK